MRVQTQAPAAVTPRWPVLPPLMASPLLLAPEQTSHLLGDHEAAAALHCQHGARLHSGQAK